MNKLNEIEKYNKISLDSIDENGFFIHLLSTFYKEKLLNDSQINKIYFERKEALKIKLNYFTKGESSSVKVETAENILKSIDYSVGLYLKEIGSIDILVDKLKKDSLASMLEAGEKLINKRIFSCKILLNEVKRSKLKVDNYAYNDTIDDGIFPFFKEYDPFYGAHESHGSVDYFICLYIDDVKYTGIEYLYKYLSAIKLENDFCNKFCIDEIIKLLQSYDKNYEVLLINIFEIVLTNALGRLISGRDFSSLNISHLDIQFINNKFQKLTKEQLEAQLIGYGEMCCENLKLEDKSLINYIEAAIKKIVPVIMQKLKINALDKVFIAYNTNEKEKIFYYKDGLKMKDSDFKAVTEEIRACSLIEDKIIIIRNNIKSVQDLIDMLDAECLFKEEYKEYFKSLSKIEIALLLKYTEEVESEWIFELDKFISSINTEEKLEIQELKEKIR